MFIFLILIILGIVVYKTNVFPQFNVIVDEIIEWAKAVYNDVKDEL